MAPQSLPKPKPDAEAGRADASMPGSLRAATAELGRIAATAEQLQHALSPLLRRAGEAGEAAQALDEIVQHLHGLADYLEAVARDCREDWRVDPAAAAAALRLDSQKLRLMLSAVAVALPAAPAVPLPQPIGSGDLELW